jgi:hypothetical protein
MEFFLLSRLNHRLFYVIDSKTLTYMVLVILSAVSLTCLMTLWFNFKTVLFPDLSIYSPGVRMHLLPTPYSVAAHVKFKVSYWQRYYRPYFRTL